MPTSTQSDKRRQNAWEALYASIGRRMSRRLFDEVLTSPSLQPRWTISKALALTVALAIHAVTVLSLLLGVRWVIVYWPSFFGVAFGLGLVLLGLASLPRPAEFEGWSVSRQQAPALYRLADEVAGALGVRRVGGIVIGEEFNAAFGRVGILRRRVLYLGLPLFLSVETDEKVALVAHELAHDRNGDPGRGAIVGTAIDSLVRWYGLVYPDRLGDVDFLQTLANLVMLGLAWVIWVGVYLLAHLVWRDSQRAEYLADWRAALVSGSVAAESLLDKVRLSDLFWPLVARAALDSWQTSHKDLFEELRWRLAQEQRRPAEATDEEAELEARLDATHPPAHLRLRLIATRVFCSPKVTLSPTDAEALEAELAPLKPGIQETLIKQYKASRGYS